MRTAALYDIHGNLPALEAVLQEIAASEVKQLIVGGDLVLGPMSEDCLNRLSQFPGPVHFICGNCELFVLDQMAGIPPKDLPPSVIEQIEWEAKNLQAYQELLASWPKTISLQVDGLGKVLFCHATPRDEHEIFTKKTATNKLLPIFEPVKEHLIVCGHTHMQFDRKIGKKRVLNAGSVGMPFGEKGAHWLLLGPDIVFKHTSYDAVSAAHLIHQSAYPTAETFASTYVLNPPSEESMLEVLSKRELE